MHKIKVVKLHPAAVLPSRANTTDTGWDLTICEIIVKKEKVFFLNTGISIEPPPGYYTEIYPRSSIYKSDFIFANSVGIIDEGYRGALMLPVFYVGNANPLEAAEELIGKKFGQLLLRQRLEMDMVEVPSLTETVRGKGGFGSTGH